RAILLFLHASRWTGVPTKHTKHTKKSAGSRNGWNAPKANDALLRPRTNASQRQLLGFAAGDAEEYLFEAQFVFAKFDEARAAVDEGLGNHAMIGVVAGE